MAPAGRIGALAGRSAQQTPTDQSRLKAKGPAAWTELDGEIDTVLRELRAANPNAPSEQAALTSLLTALG